ncbi:phenylalanine--tRNA ligase subunit beta [Granulicella arctica]|uniref:Phenylalanine--tRNA ligase beta subunit n=1 Tax=Granulicella arctica TaxID=940613 RepID=A0A7Y9PFP5_9BACT|nr:phenylalanine--tRNA ligase subunit beta [Granulicella arctica]NYF79085.1 phenylalanyl-tRNA synthetase beta chain [Granulicella arctica]
MKILTNWLRTYVPNIPADDQQLADDLTLRGIAVEGVHSLGPNSGHLFEMDITTNRVDAMNHYGIAREAATIYNLPLAPFDTKLPLGTLVDEPFPVRIAPDAKGLCGRFTAQVLRGVTIAPSTGAIKTYFEALGQKQISNAVDASNFVLLGMGHPTHAFDLDKIDDGIVVRLAHKGEKLRLLDGTERTLEADDLVVADETKALALAGVMGGWDSMITPGTKNILVEAAWFDQASIRRSSRRHGLHTDASHRFERGADLNAAPIANGLVSRLILQSGGSIEGELIDIIDPEVAARTAARPAIELSVKQVQRHLGTTLDPQGITSEIVAQYLTSLGCELLLHGPDLYATKLPSWRLDLEREIDLIEEVARVYGYNRFANTLPTPGIVIAHPTAAKEAAVRTRLLALGYSESVSSTFASQSDSDLFYGTAKTAAPVPMENPLSEEASLLRPSLVPGMVTMLAHNLNRDVKEVRLFEQGQVFTGTTLADGNFIAEVHEAARLSLGLTGSVPATPLYAASDAPFYELKGVVESLLSLFDLAGSTLTFSAEAPAWLEPGRSATALLAGKPIATFGELVSTQSQQRKLRQPVFLAEIDLAQLYTLPLRKVTARDLSRFQAVERDFSFTFSDATPWQNIAAAIESLGIADLIRLTPTEIFRDPKGRSVPPGHYALLLRCIFQSNERTLNEEELTGWWSAIIGALTALGGVIRAPGSTLLPTDAKTS